MSRIRPHVAKPDRPRGRPGFTMLQRVEMIGSDACYIGAA